MAPHYEKVSPTNVDKLIIAKSRTAHQCRLHIDDVIIVAKSAFAPPENFRWLRPWVLFLIVDYGPCFLRLLATLLVITFPIFSTYFTYAYTYA